jgi:hypothetical protein
MMFESRVVLAYEDDERALANKLLIVTLFALAFGVLLGVPVWQASDEARGFVPLAPLIDWNLLLPTFVLDSLYVILPGVIFSLLLSMAKCWHAPPSQRRAIALVMLIVAIFVLGDQNRLQPWVFHYMCCLFAAARRWKRDRGARHLVRSHFFRHFLGRHSQVQSSVS